MVDSSKLIKGMEVFDSARVHVGIVDHYEGSGIKIARRESLDGQHHHIPLDWIERIDQHVHLNRTAAEAMAGWPQGARAATTAPVAAAAGPERKVNWLAWLALLAGLLALLIFGMRGCDKRHTAASTTTTTTAANGTPAVAVQSVTLPGGRTVELTPGTLNYELQAFLASDAAAPRRFAFDKLNFATGSAAIRDEDRPTIDALAQILAAYPNARVRLIGFTDAVGSAASNHQLSGERAKAVAAALVAKGVDNGRLATAAGGESDPAASNANGDGRAENRRTELEVTAK